MSINESGKDDRIAKVLKACFRKSLKQISTPAHCNDLRIGDRDRAVE